MDYPPRRLVRLPPAQRCRARRDSLWCLGAGEVTVVLACAVVVVWATILWLVPRGQPVLGGDFVVFYTFGRAARLGEWTIQYNWPAFHQLQISLVPASDSYFYPPAYPPLVPLLYAPFSLLLFPLAYGAWTAFSTVTYSTLLMVSTRACGVISRPQAIMAGLLFPPFIAHQAIGHSTVWPLIGFVGGWWALTKSRPALAGLMLSIVAIKPHLGIALAIVVLGTRLWRILSGILLGLTLQAGITLAICGPEAVVAYLATTVRVLRDTKLIEPQDERFTHAVRMSLEGLVPHGVATGGWIVATALFGWLLVKVWRETDDWTLRVSALLLATLLISPHVQAYDAILLAPASLWLVDWALSTRRPEIAVGVIAVSVAFVMPAARISGVPLTLPLMVWLLWRLAWIPSVGMAPHPKTRTPREG